MGPWLKDTVGRIEDLSEPLVLLEQFLQGRVLEREVVYPALRAGGPGTGVVIAADSSVLDTRNIPIR